MTIIAAKSISSTPKDIDRNILSISKPSSSIHRVEVLKLKQILNFTETLLPNPSQIVNFPLLHTQVK
jgi:hypothetical protein